MNKQEIIENLEKVKHWEDEFILKYDNDTFWELLKTLPNDKCNKIKQLIEINISDTKSHKTMIENLIKFIGDGKYEL